MATKNRIAAIGLWLPAVALVAGTANLHEAAQSGPQNAADAEKIEQRMDALNQQEVGAAPLFVFGDVNEDGKVDAADLALMRQLAAGKTPAAAICPAAGDLNQDGKVDASDVAAMQKMISAGKVAALELGFPYRLPCSFENLPVAAHPNADGHGGNSIYFLDPRFTTENSTVEAAAGDAAVTATADHHAYIVDALAAQGESGTVTLKITLGKNGSGGTFTYSYHFGP